MIVPDWAWRRLGHRWMDPFDPARVNPVSVDLLLGEHILLQRHHGVEYDDRPARLFTWTTADKRGTRTAMTVQGGSSFQPAYFRAGDSVLAATVEKLTLPRWMRMQGTLKSSVARAGLNHRNALYVDPGFVGRLTLEIDFDRSGWLIPYQPVIQVEAMVGLPQHPYRGRYQDQTEDAPVPNRNTTGIAFRPQLPPRWDKEATPPPQDPS